MITIIDYGCGNITAFVNAFKRLNILSKIARKKVDVENAERIILPGVGAFDYVMKSFNESGMREIVERKVIEENVPVIGICAGMQILADDSEEGSLKGLGWVKGKVRIFDTKRITHKTKLPHMGWNTIQHNGNKLFKNLPDDSRFYFVHSYYFDNQDPLTSIATTDYGGKFSCSVNVGNVFGVQFHPEKSHQNGQQLLLNFANI